MTMPHQLKPFISDRDWRRLALHELPSEFRKDVIEILLDVFEHKNPKAVRDESIDTLLDFAQTYADNLRGASRLDWRGLDEGDVRGGVELSEYVARQDQKDGDEIKQELNGEEEEREAVRAKRREQRAAQKAEREKQKAQRAKEEEEKNRSPFGGQYQ
jgi:hypothetical protein